MDVMRLCEQIVAQVQKRVGNRYAVMNERGGARQRGIRRVAWRYARCWLLNRDPVRSHARVLVEARACDQNEQGD
jgi:hypothetical protein